MIVHFNKFDNYEVPDLVLCLPCSTLSDGTASDVVAVVPFASNLEFVFNFNDISQMNFRIDLVNRDSNYYEESKRVYDLVVKGMYIYVDEVGYFRIDEADETQTSFERYKDVSASSCDSELSNRSVPYIENGTYQLSEILFYVNNMVPQWTIGYIDDDLRTLYRTFTDVDITRNVFDFLIKDVQELYDCIFIFDTKERTINVYAKSNYRINTDIHLTKEDMITAISKRVSNDTPYSSMSGYGDSNDISISAVNPLGTNVVFNLSYFIQFMPQDLAEDVQTWMTDIRNAEADYYNARVEYTVANNTVLTLSYEIEKATLLLSTYNRCKDNVSAYQTTVNVDIYNDAIEDSSAKIPIMQDVNDTLAAIQDLIDDCEAEIAQKNTEIEVARTLANNKLSVLLDINERLSFDSYFSYTDYKKLVNYIYEGVYTNENIGFTDETTDIQKLSITKQLYDLTKQRLRNLSAPIYEYDIDTDNFVFIPKFEYWIQQLATGSIVNIEVDDNTIRELYITSISINYEDRNSSFTFCTEQTGTGAKVLFDNLFDGITKSSSSIRHI